MITKLRFSIADQPEAIDPYITDLAACIARSKKTVFVTGAGISCNSGIPDFRSSDGLYNLVKKKHPKAVLRGQELFDAMLFKDKDKTLCFYTFMAELKTLIDKAKPTATHHFIHGMKEKGRLLRCYTQNIDCLENELGDALVQLHGNMDKVRCTLCSASYEFSKDHQQQFRSGSPPLCPDCEDKDSERQRLGKRSLSMGTLRPAVVLYNEDHPQGETIGATQAVDIGKRPDLLIVMGTSLKIPALKKFIKDMARSIHHNHPYTGRVIFVNKTEPTKDWDNVFDYQVMGDADTWVTMTEEKLLDTKAMTAAKLRLREAVRRQQQQDEEDDDDDDDKENVDIMKTAARRRKRAVKSSTSKAATNSTKVAAAATSKIAFKRSPLYKYCNKKCT